MTLNRERDRVETLYHKLMNLLEMLPFRVHKDETLAGLVFFHSMAITMRTS